MKQELPEKQTAHSRVEGDDMQKTLQGVKVLDMTMAISGPIATRILSDFGADVVLVEPTGGSSIRTFGPHYMGLKCFGKKSVGCDLKTPEGKEIIKKLVEWADVFVSNYRAAGLERLGMSYEDLKAINPKLVYATITGFGNEGPNAGDMGFDVVCYYGRSGMLTDSVPKGNVLHAPYGGGDVNSGEVLALGVCAALYKRAMTGEGSKISTSLMENGIFVNFNNIVEAQYGETYPREKYGVARPLLNSYECSDGRYITINAQHHWETSWPCICNLIGRPDLIEKVHNKDEAMGEMAGEINVAIAEGFKKHTSEEVYNTLFACGTISVSKAQHSAEVASDEQAIINEMVFPYKDAEGREVMMPATPLRFGDNKAAHYEEPEKFGTSTKAVLRELGYSEEKIRELVEKKVVYADGEGPKPSAVII